MCSMDLSNHQYGGGTSSLRMLMCGTEEAHHQYKGECEVRISHIISTNEGAQYRTTKTALGAGGCIYLGKIYYFRCTPVRLSTLVSVSKWNSG